MCKSGRARRIAAGIAVAAVFPLLSCGVKAPPQPRELVVPAPVRDLAVTTVPEGVRISFTLPAESLDGSSLKGIGGYRILREGPGGKDVRQEIRFSVSERKQWLGKAAVYLDAFPGAAGVYRYCVVPFDVYGSRPSARRIEASCWEGFVAEAGADPNGQSREPAP